jgi:hypothetical protein
MNLLDITKYLSDADESLDIYAAIPWIPETEAIFVWVPDGVDAEDYVRDMPHFLSVSETKGLMDRWIEIQKPSLREQCEALIRFARGPAWTGIPSPKRS